MSNLNLNYKRKYGLDWPINAHDIFIDLSIAKKWREFPYKEGSILAPEEHMLRAIRALFTTDQVQIHRWFEEHVYDWCHETFCITWGGASCGKSNDVGLLVLLDWCVDPTQTIAMMASTTAEMLEVRSFESTIRYFNALKRNPYFYIPGKQSRQRLAIINDTDDDAMDTTVKASIKGVAVSQGSANEARAKLQGAHLPYVRLVLDELSQMRPAAMDVRTNLSIGAKDFRLFGLCNPDSINDLAGRYSTPLGGWSTVDPSMTRWDTQWGCVRHHNGFQSPAITEPNGATLYPFLINQAKIDEILKEHNGNADAPAIHTMVVGWPPPTGSVATVLTEGMITMFKMQDAPVWNSEPLKVAGFDPAFSADGDDPVLVTGLCGYDVSGKYIIAFDKTFNLKIEASNPRPVTYQLLDQLREIQQEEDFDFSNLGIDDSGTQSVADIVEVETGSRVFRVNFGSKASELPVSMANQNPAKTVYQNRITEYYFALVEYAQRQQIRGLPADAAAEFCQRRLAEGKRPKRLETKKEAKKRIKRSPDHADACAVLIGVVREKIGLVPGASETNPNGPARPVSGTPITEDMLRMYDLDGRENNYLTPMI